MSAVTAVVLAAGKGTRMQSHLPKVLHEVAGKSMVLHVVENLRAAHISRIGLVLSEDLSGFESFLRENPDLLVCLQKERRGTADAVASAAAFFKDVVPPRYAQLSLWRGVPQSSDHVLICAGDTPALTSEFFRDLLKFHQEAAADLTIVGMKLPDPTGYGRLVLGEHASLTRIVEQKDATPTELEIDLCNSGVLLARSRPLFSWLDRVEPNNAQKEYYLTDIVQIAVQAGAKVKAYLGKDPEIFAGVNDLIQKEKMHTYLKGKS
jgi:bifunctional UDP-N-acetylglucosamine pyrophosphorylase/glucosamine-1-phosphate N-acetyltransferase